MLGGFGQGRISSPTVQEGAVGAAGLGTLAALLVEGSQGEAGPQVGGVGSQSLAILVLGLRQFVLAQVQAARPTRDWDARYGKATGSWTTNMFVEAAYRSLSK